ncbi:MAG TPA: glycoside hydrolase family 2 TIM barrel-domain containing protein, partial [Clostridia bacterium]|nr:glycoside hydrolase family 2 TIM barrel-domain containing protein [Clostridia bacterium]
MKCSRPCFEGEFLSLLSILLILLALLPKARAARVEMDFSGSWQYAKVSQLSFPPTNSWQTMNVPGFLSGWQYEHAWFRKVFTIPAPMAGTQLKLRFGGVKYNAQVWLNGNLVGSYFNGYEPFELDITTLARAGQSNELLVGVTDWTATFVAPVDFSTLGQYENPRDHAKNSIIAPIGGRYEQYGIWQPVKLVSLSAVSISDVFVMPSVRTQQLTVRLTVRNDTVLPQTIALSNRVTEGTNTALVLPERQITAAPATTTQLDITVPWSTAHQWTHLDPFLYQLETALSGATGQDQVTTRFGFREFWTEKGEFYLNGTPIHLLATASWPPSDLLDTNQIRRILQDVKAGNNVAIRFHTQPWDAPWYDVADEIGLLVVEECAVWCDPWSYKLSDSIFWTNYAQHISAAVKRDRNHPS